MINKNEGLSIARLLMVLSIISPLFILWAIREANVKGLPEGYFLAFCALMIVVPNGFLWLRVRQVKKQRDKNSMENLRYFYAHGSDSFTLSPVDDDNPLKENSLGH